jgi:hypothetical protein
MLDFRAHTIKTIQIYKLLIWSAIKENLKTEGISIMNNHEDAKNRNYHKGAHICAISCNWATEEAKKAGSGSIEQILSKEARKDPKNWSYSYINVSTAVDYHFEDENVYATVELRANKYDKDNYVLVLKDNKVAFHRIGDLKILENGTSQQGKDVYYLGPLEFKEYKSGGKLNKKYLDNFKPEYLGNYAPNDKQFRGNYNVVVESEKGAKEIFSDTSWKAIAEKINDCRVPLLANTLQKWARKNKYVNKLKMSNGEVERIFTLYLAKGENLTITQAIELAKHEEKIRKSVKSANKVLSKEKEKENMKTESWTTLKDMETPSYLLERDNFKNTYTCVNKPLGVLPTRKNEEVHKQNYLFECDRISLEKQADIINDLPEEMQQAILWCCYSGNKSIHTVIATNTPDEADSEMRKYIHESLNQTWFQGEADYSTYNAARLARTPNAVRENGKKQSAFIINDDKAIPYDVTDIIEEFKESKAKKDKARRKLAEKYHNISENNKVHTLEQLKSWNEKHPSKAKQEAIDLLEGNLKDWNRSSSAVRSLLKFGFDEYEIETEAPYNDKWVKSALKFVLGGK